MKEIWKHLIKIKEQVKNKKNVLLMLDFDGTISPIMPTPEQAYLPKKTRQTLETINKFSPVIIISGRALNVVQQKVGVDEFIYSGSHGLEWSIKKKKKLKVVPKYILNMLARIKDDLEKLVLTYPEIIVEERRFAVTFHYKFVSPKKMKELKNKLNTLLKPIKKNPKLVVLRDKETIDIVPRLNWNKGHVASFMYRYFKNKTKKSLLPIYIGDGQTDEDAFSVLKRSGITIRVGKNDKSTAKWYLRNQKEVNYFLDWLS